MAAQFLDAFTQYLCDWIYYLLCLAGWIQLSGLSLLFTLQAALEAEVALRLRKRGSAIFFRGLALLLFLGLFWWGTRNLMRQRLVVNPETFWSLGLSAERVGDFPKAIHYFRRGVAEGEGDPVFYLEFAEALHQNGQNQAALAAARSSSGESMPKDLMIGRIYFSLSDYARAQKFLEKAREKAPDDFLVQAWLGETYSKLNRPQMAAEVFMKILRNNSLPEALRGQILEKIKRLKNTR